LGWNNEYLKLNDRDFNMKNASLIAGILTATAAFAFVSSVTPAAADVFNATIFNNILYDQTSNSNAPPTSPTGGFFAIGGSFNTAGSYTSATATYPGPNSPVTLPLVSPANTSFNYSPPVEPLSQIPTDFPHGTYTISHPELSPRLPPSNITPIFSRAAFLT
jgi:hypothetical protein